MTAYLQSLWERTSFGMLHAVLFNSARAQEHLSECGFSTLEYAIGASVFVAFVAVAVGVLTGAVDNLFDRLGADIDAIAP